ncbi:unnamed protein product [Linum tenue]|uniref:Uncharacterized protein n=1 Tax=Linum tenue TaxID=586396 RepID=A0AAV0PWQ5_9ROSI|nr:unnamed protein product [Linum tenue]
MCPNNLSFLEKLVPQEHFHRDSPQCFRWLFKSATTEKFFLWQRLQEYNLGQWLLLKWFFTQITDFRARNFLCFLFLLHPSKGQENLDFLVPSLVAAAAGFARASGVLNWFPWALMCILRFASRLNPFPHISQKWACSASSSTASSSTTSPLRSESPSSRSTSSFNWNDSCFSCSCSLPFFRSGGSRSSAGIGGGSMD